MLIAHVVSSFAMSQSVSKRPKAAELLASLRLAKIRFGRLLLDAVERRGILHATNIAGLRPVVNFQRYAVLPKEPKSSFAGARTDS
jgi:hypothetical protein